jgi:hypothetical protein
MRNRIPGMAKCWGRKCPNDNATSLFSDDTVVIGKKAYCSACSPAQARRRARRPAR